MYYSGEQNVPGAAGNLKPYANLAGLQLPLPGELNRGGAFRQPGYRPGREVEEIPGRPMRPSDYQGPPAIPTQGIPFASFMNGRTAMGNGRTAMGNAGAAGNSGAIAMGNQGLYNGPQYGQELLPGTVKYVY
jgi:hypothetical protein